MLPPPVLDTDEAWARRDTAARAMVAALLPAGPVEANLAVHHVASMAHAAECTSQAAQCIGDVKAASKLRAQAASMGREARGFLTKLESVQKARRQRAASDDEQDGAHLAEPCTFGRMTDAMAQLPARPPRREMVAPAEAAAKSAPPAKWPPLRDYDDWTPEEKAAEKLRGEAGRYATLNPVRVRIIRQLGGLPPDCDYEPPRPEVLHEIIHGNGSNLRWADTYVPYVMPEPEAETEPKA